MPEAEARWIVVSGAGGALGSEIARHFAAKGRHVLALDRNTDRLTQSSAGANLLVRQIDLASRDDLRRTLADTIPQTDRISLLVNAVGQIWNEPVLSLRGGRFASHETDSLRRVIDANLVVPFIVATEVAARMARHGGAIVNFSSIASSGNPGQAAYSAAKAGIEGMTRAMAAELGPLRIRVNAIAPGFIDVATTRDAVPSKQLGNYADRTPLVRLGTPDDVIGAIEFLESNAFVTGEILRIDGGLRL